MLFDNNFERPGVFLDEGIMFKISPNPVLNLTQLRTTGARIQSELVEFGVRSGIRGGQRT